MVTAAFVHPAPPNPPELPEGVTLRPRWRAWTSVAALFSALVAATILGAVLYIASGVSNFDDAPAGISIAATVLQDACFVGAAILYAGMTSRPRPAQFGLRPARFWWAVLWVFAGYLTFLLFSGIWLSIIGVHQRDSLPDDLGANQSTAALIAVMLLVTVIAPLAEEFFFRGYFFTALRGWLGLWGAAVVTGLFFGAIHVGSAPVGYLVPLAFFGFVLCLVYWRTGSLVPCIALHALNNSLAFGVSQHWDWQIPVLAAGALCVLAVVLLPLVRGASMPRRLVA